MIKLYLITGFLGAGKTTLLKNLIDLLKCKRISVIVNEFGKAGVDGALLKEIGVHLDEINNGSIFCSCRLDKFENVLMHHIELNPEIILVEASGLSDPTAIKKILSNNDRFSGIEYGGCICLVDAMNFIRVIDTAKVCKRQLNISDAVIINKIDIATTEQVEQAVSLVQLQNPHCTIYKTSFAKVNDNIFDELISNENTEIGYHTKDVSLQKYLIKVKDSFSKYQLIKFIEMFVDTTYRVKGFVNIEGKTMLVDCVANTVKITPFTGEIESVNSIVVLSGAKMDTKKQINIAINWYKEHIISFE